MQDQSKIKDDVHDPVKPHLDAKDGRPNIEEAFGGKRTISPPGANGPEHGPIPEEAENETELSDFAANVMAGLNDVGISVDLDQHHIETDQELAAQTQQHDAPEQMNADAAEFEAYFSGWDGPEETERETDFILVDEADQAPQPETEPLEQTFAVSPETSSSHLASFETDYDENEKHDALADAVQAALLSVYGGQTSNPPASAIQRPSPRDGESAEWIDGNAKRTLVEDELSPQDVILNYFDYQVDAPSFPRENGAHPFAEDRKVNQNFAAPARQTANAVQSRQDESAFRGASVRPANAALDTVVQTAQRYEGPPAFPPPAAVETAKDRAAANKDSGRLLGAAGIGLIGGIAIAATLAVFFINSYGPALPVGDKQGAPQPAQRRANSNRSATTDLDARGTPAISASVIATDVSGPAGQPIALAIGVQSTRPAEQTLVSITRVPEGVRLSAGVDAGGGNWLLPPKRLNGLTLTAQADRAESFELEAQLLDSNARTALSEKKQFSVALEKPVAAAPEPQKPVAFANPAGLPAQTPSLAAPVGRELNTANASSLPAFNTQTVPVQALPSPRGSSFAPEVVGPATDQTLPGSVVVAPEKSAQNANLAVPPTASAVPQVSASEVAELEDLIREGNKRMRDGDIVQARSLYARAVVSGDADAALAMGRSFDPIYFERLDKKNAEPDAARAFEWYKQAMDRGATQTAKMRIDNLKQYLNK